MVHHLSVTRFAVKAFESFLYFYTFYIMLTSTVNFYKVLRVVTWSSCVTSTLCSNCTNVPWSELRLPSWVEPVHYELQLLINVNKDNFTGKVDIELKVNQETDFIVLHSKQLNIVRVNFSSTGGSATAKSFQICNDTDRLSVFLQQKLIVGGKYNLSIEFWGELSDKKSDGLYKHLYKSPNGSERYFASTQFAPAEARAVFPCWDEPLFKAYFTLKIIRPANLFSLSNMKIVEKRILPDGLVEDRFAKSVKMSTYLVAVVLCDFAKISATTSRGLNVSFYAPHFQINQTELALNISVRGLEFFENLFKINFPSEKIDFVIVPNFPASGMENWGLITLKPENSLYDPNKQDLQLKEIVSFLILHEISHQWFGNLVTMKWWNDIWLNEGFAKFLQIYAMDKLQPDWNCMTSYVAEIMVDALNFDGSSWTRAVSTSISDDRKAMALFDVITYNKASAILRMVMRLLGEEKFKNGINEYLSTYQYSNTEGMDLWNVIDKHADGLYGVNLIDFATNFTQQHGYPLITIQNRNGKLHVSQTRFYILREEMEKHRGQQQWHIYLTAKSDSGNKLVHWVKRTHKEIEINFPSTGKWYKANDETYGYYRVNYDEKNWDALIKQFKEDHTYCMYYLVGEKLSNKQNK